MSITVLQNTQFVSNFSHVTISNCFGNQISRKCKMLPFCNFFIVIKKKRYDII
jgi:hypothetical protein